jgi:diaminohydroxyphosphoribosylaminopyrimidine deaminase/5-amino-6-(5-phosphoribosylamino)uracil reductase
MSPHEKFMRRAIDLAWTGLGRNSPNPLVGCVVVQNDEIVGEGAHLYEKVDHAETIALREAGDKAKGATVYCTLEPCSHTGRTPPCADALVKAGIGSVVYGLKDPNLLVNGGGHSRLEDAGIKVIGGVLEDDVREQNKFFVTVHEKGRPFVLSKWAMTADGKIATRTGESKWISSPDGLNFGHHLRNIFDAILVGHGTILTDNPRLTSRPDLAKPLPAEFFPVTPEDVRNPRRVIVDAFGSTCDYDLNVFDQPGKTIVAVAPESVWDDVRARDSIDQSKIELIECPLKGGHIDLSYLLTQLRDIGVNSLMVEGGSGIHAAFLNEGLVDEVVALVSTKIFGGESAPSPVGGGGVERVSEAWTLANVKHMTVGDDVVVWGKLEYPEKAED